MNALNRDLIKLTMELEALKGPMVASDEWRLGFHLMPPVGWLNDPNGLCEFKGEYHVFYQYSPFNEEGGLKLWGHYTSHDFVNWCKMPTALYADQVYDCHGVYSGSAFIEEDKMYLYYTGNVKHLGNGFDYVTTGREQNTVLAISEDGKTFKHKELLMTNEAYGKDMSLHVRDPKVWKENDTYYMVQGARDLEDQGKIIVFSSKDKVNWERINVLTTPEKLGYMWECPDFFTIDGHKVLMTSPQGLEADGMKYQNIYQCGYFFLEGDFTSENYTLSAFDEMDRGFDFYAPQTFEDSKGRRIMIGWMGLPDIQDLYSNPTTERGWQHALTLPRELRVLDGKLHQLPLEELKALRKTHKALEVEENLTDDAFHTFEMEMNFEKLTGPVEICIKESAKLLFDPATNCMHLNFVESGYGRTMRSVQLERLEDLRLFVDTSSLEIFINNGQEVFTTRFYPTADQQGITLKGEGLKASINLWEMGSMTIENTLTK